MNHRLQQLLAAENISQSQFADTIGVARASVSHILAGRNKPGFDFIESIARHYPEINLEWIITGKGKMYKSPALKTGRTVVADDNLFPDFNEEQVPINPNNSCQNNDLTTKESNIAINLDKAVEDASDSVSKSMATQAAKLPFTKSNTLSKNIQQTNNQRNISKIIIFYDDNTYQELK